MLHQFLEALTHVPTLTRFAIAMCIFLLAPPLCARLRLPAVVGLLLAGVALGPSGVRILPQHGPVAQFFADIGKLLLMFFAGLEIDLAGFRRTGKRSALFGSLTFLLPLLTGAAVGLVFGYSWLASLLIGSLLASHTLLGFPVAQRLGLAGSDPVGVTVGATVFTDLGALLILAVCLPIYTVGFSVGTFTLQIVELAIFVPLVLVGLSAAGKWFMERFGQSKESQVLFMFLVIALAGEGAEVIHLEAIVGAFLAGLAVNRVVRESEARHELEFIGNTLFVPAFFVTIGFLIDVRVFIQTIVNHLGLVVGIVGGLIASKFLAAMVTRRVIGYTRQQGLLMWSLSLPQVAATLAAALVAFQAKNAAGVRLIDDLVVNTIIVLLVVTSILGPILTQRFCLQLGGREGTG